MDFLQTLFTPGIGNTEVWAPFILRVGLGLGLLQHALPKWKTFDQFKGYVVSLKFPAPTLFAHLARLTETLGSVLLVLGIGVKAVSLGLVLYFLIVIFTAHRGQKFYGGWELPYLYLLGALSLWAMNSSGALAIAL